MSDFSISIAKTYTVSQNLNSAKNRLRTVANDSALRRNDAHVEGLLSALANLRENIETVSVEVGSLQTALDQIVSNYSDAENAITGKNYGNGNNVDALSGKETETVSGEFFGIKWSKTTEMESSSASSTETIKYPNLEEGYIGYEHNFELKGQSGRGKVAFTTLFELLNIELEGVVAPYAIKGSVSATLFKDGKLSPDFHFSLEGEAADYEGTARARFGTEESNIYAVREAKLGSVGYKVGYIPGERDVEFAARGEANYLELRGTNGVKMPNLTIHGIGHPTSTHGGTTGIALQGVDLHVDGAVVLGNDRGLEAKCKSSESEVEFVIADDGMSAEGTFSNKGFDVMVEKDFWGVGGGMEWNEATIL